MTESGLQDSYYHRGGSDPLLGMTIPAMLADVLRKYPDCPAIVSRHQDRRLSYAEFAAAADHLAKGLLGSGFGRGDRIGIWSTNNVEWVLLQMATARIGAVLVNINPAYRRQELGYALERSAIQALFVIPAFRSSDYVAMLVKLIPELQTAAKGALSIERLPYLRQIIIFDPLALEKTARPCPGLTTWQEILAAGEGISEHELAEVTASLDRDDPINIEYTSGTTGFPKAVILSHHNLLNNAWFAAQAMHFSHRDRLCVPVPFYHCFGMVLSNLLCLCVGACIVLPAEHFDPLATLQAIEQERCTAVHGVPTMFIAELEHAEFDNFDLTCLRTGIMAGAPCPPVLMQRVIEEMHCTDILIGYGETEASPLTHLTSTDDSLAVRTETVGRNLPHQEVKVVDTATGRTLPVGETGEICFRGYHVMQGYYGDPEATRQAVDQHGWLHSGDLGEMDPTGCVRITGRLKEMIVRAGENIYPREIEDFLYTNPKIAEVAVFGYPDDYYGEVVMAWIKLHSGETATAEEIQGFCRDEIAHYKIPQYVWFVDEFPMTVTGKLQKFRMREIVAKQMQASSPN